MKWTEFRLHVFIGHRHVQMHARLNFQHSVIVRDFTVPGLFWAIQCPLHLRPLHLRCHRTIAIRYLICFCMKSLHLAHE